MTYPTPLDRMHRTTVITTAVALVAFVFFVTCWYPAYHIRQLQRDVVREQARLQELVQELERLNAKIRQQEAAAQVYGPPP